MILPERVLGRSGVNSRYFGPGDRADDVGDVLAQLDGQRVVTALTPARRMTKAKIAWPVIASVLPTTAASATLGWSTSADSTSIVLIRWPATFITSSTRPSSQ